jgi:hypothetical protein
MAPYSQIDLCVRKHDLIIKGKVASGTAFKLPTQDHQIDMKISKNLLEI